MDAALSLKPEERRRFFEEAAGIGLYRSRREESIEPAGNDPAQPGAGAGYSERAGAAPGEPGKTGPPGARNTNGSRPTCALLRDWYGYHWHRTQQDWSHAREVSQCRKCARAQPAKPGEVESQLNEPAQASLMELRERLNELAYPIGGAAPPAGKGQPRPGGDG